MYNKITQLDTTGFILTMSIPILLLLMMLESVAYLAGNVIGENDTGRVKSIFEVR